MSNPELSVVIPIVERAGALEETCRGYYDVLTALDVDYEVIFVLDIADDAVNAYVDSSIFGSGRVTSIKLTGRYGDSTALATGLDAVRAEKILVLPPYPQIDPDDIPTVIAGLDDHDLVYAERKRTADSAINRVQGRVFSWLISRIADIQVQDAGCEVRALRKDAADQLIFHGDLHTFLPLLAHRLGFSVGAVSVEQSEKDRNARVRNPLVYLRRLIDILNIAFLIKFTKKPLRFFGMIGSSLILMGGIILTYIVFERLVFDVDLASRPALFIGALMAVVGVQILAVGLVGEIITFAHAGKSKEYHVKEVVSPGMANDPEEDRQQGFDGPELSDRAAEG